MNQQLESAKHYSEWTIRKFSPLPNMSSEHRAMIFNAGNPHNMKEGEPDETVIITNNLLLNVGITEMWGLIIGDGGAIPYNNANSQIGVGSDATAEVATQTGLLDASADFVGMEASFPVLTGQTLTFRGVFDGSTANFDWREFAVANGSPATTGIVMNRRVDVQGTKAAGQTWTLDLSITLS